MSLLNKTIRGIISVSLLLSIVTTVYAEPSTESLNKQKQQLENQKNSYNQGMQQNQISADDAQKEINKITSQIYALDSKIEALNKTIAETNNKISSKEADIKVSQANLDKAMEDIKDDQVLYNKRIRAMYINGTDQYLEVLLSANNFSDLFNKVEAITSITNYDKKVIKDLNDKKEAIRVTQENLQKDKDTLLKYKKENESSLAQVQESMKQQTNLVEEAKTKKQYYMSQVAEYRNKVAATDKQVQDTIKQIKALAEAEAKKNQQNNSGSANAPVSSNAIVSYASKFLGSPYVWGAAGKTFSQSDINMYKGTVHDLTGMDKYLGRQAFDCSGLMQYVYRHFDIYIGRTTYDQINDGFAVDRSNLKPGDLIFFGSWSDPYHVGMYAGNNCYIEAPYSGALVRISSLADADEYLCARRIIK